MESGGNAWVLRTFGEARQYAGNDGYRDTPDKEYRFDSFVQNWKQVGPGDIAFVAGRDQLIGVARIQTRVADPGYKTRSLCPVGDCQGRQIKRRRTKSPEYRCEAGHEFAVPELRKVPCTVCAVGYEDTFFPVSNQLTLADVLATQSNKATQNSILRLDYAAVTSLLARRLPAFLFNSIKSANTVLLAAEGLEGSSTPYEPLTDDRRAVVERQIRERRGQGTFRRDLLRRFGRQCVISACSAVPVLEAAHISPYRGEEDNAGDNGLLLRADLHTLFDLNLIGIEPETLLVRLHPSLSNVSDYERFDGASLRCNATTAPSRAALQVRWKVFESRFRIRAL